MSEVQTTDRYAPINVGNTTVDIRASTSDWFALYIGTAGTRHQTTLYLKRCDLRALRDRLNDIDLAMPEPGEES